MYGIVSSKRFHTFIRRPDDSTSRSVEFSMTFDSEQQTSPSVCLVYLYLLHLAQGSPLLHPHLRPTTAPELKWVTSCNNKKRPRGNDQGVESGSKGDARDSSDASKPCPAHGNMEDSHPEDADANASDSTAGPNGSAANTRSKDASAASQNDVPSSSKPTGKHVSSKLQRSTRSYLQSLPIVTRPCLDFSTLQIGRHCVVRPARILACIVNFFI